MSPGHTGILSRIVSAALRLRGVVLALAFALIGYGVYSLTRASYDVFPEFAPPQVMIQSLAPGLAPEEVELLITQPIENAINGLPGIVSLRSSSFQGLSVITVIFHSGRNIYQARQEVAERLTSVASQLPPGLPSPILTPLTSSISVILEIGLVSEKLSLMELRTLADWTIKPRLLAASGVAKVVIFGGAVKEYQIQVKPEQLFAHGLSIEDVLARAGQATGLVGAGFIDNENQHIILQAEGQALSADDLARTVLLHRLGANVTLADVARVVPAPKPILSIASVNGRPGVVLLVSSQYGANTLAVTRSVEKALADLKPGLSTEGVTVYPGLFRAANFIETALHNLRVSLLIGAILVVLVLFLFLLNLRTAAISCLAIPLSLLAAIIVLERLGFTLNTMTLGGLAIAIGEVVDDAVIDVENILRRLRENRHLPNPRPVFQVILDASLEVRSAVVYATFAVSLVFVPVLTMSGLAGKLFAPLGIAYILAIMASLLVALTVTPALALILLGRQKFPEREPFLMRRLKRHYQFVLGKVERRPRLLIVAVVCVSLLGIGLIPFLHASFLPQLRENNYIVHMTAVPGTSLEESLRIGDHVTQLLLALPWVQSVAQRAGQATESDDVLGSHRSEFNVDLKHLSGAAALTAHRRLLQALTPLAGLYFSANTFLTERVNETLSGYPAPVVVNIFGDDLDTLDRIAREIAPVLNQVPGASQVQLQSPPGTPQLTMRLRANDLAHWGFRPVEVLRGIGAAFQGTVVAQIYDQNRVRDVTVVLEPDARKRITQVNALPLRSSDGVYVRLGQLCAIGETSGRYVILHQGARRLQTITCNISGNVNSFVAAARKRIAAAIPLPATTYIEFTGTAEEQARSARELWVHASLAGLGILLLLSVVIGRARNLLLLLLNLPFALVGGVLAVLASHETLSIGALVGFVTLFGITLRNSIMLISHFEHLVSVEGMTWGPEAALRGAAERVTPILMTALVTGLGLLPLAIASGTAGREIEGPMAIVILGGLVTSTLLNLLALPTLALRYGRFRERREPPTNP